ncbi:MAG: hypothetical protein Q9160_000641 [Pyrenula sp. 1 TL-2023]
MQLSNTDTCNNSNGDCLDHFHVENSMLAREDDSADQSRAQDIRERNISFKGPLSDSTLSHEESNDAAEKRQDAVAHRPKNDDRGFRRIIRNFTPSYAAPMSAYTLAISNKTLQMVHHRHEHRRCLHRAAPTPLQRPLARNHLHYFLRPESRVVPPVHFHNLSALYSVSIYLSGSTTPSAPELVPGYIPGWPCNAD